MKTARLIALSSLTVLVALTTGTLGGGKKPGGGGGSTPDPTYQAVFTIHDQDLGGNLYDLLSDLQGDYSESNSNVYAEIVGSGNPLLKLSYPGDRSAKVDLSGCAAYDSQTESLLAEGGSWHYVLGLSPYGTVNSSGQTVNGFLGLAAGERGLTLLGIGLEPPSDGRSWSLRFDPGFGSDLAVVTRGADGVTWAVSTVGRTAVIVRPPVKGNGPKEVVAECQLDIEYSVTCDTNNDGVCDVKLQ